jgi:dihydroflavonol-4-reductase
LKVLVTGATGFLGSYVTEDLQAHGIETFATYRKGSDTSRLQERGIPLIPFDLTDAKSMRDAVRGLDAVVHLAAYYTFVGRRELYQRLNVDATRDLLDACLAEGVGRFIYCSSTEAMGPTEGVADENSPLRPQYDYGRSKVQAEELVREYGRKGLAGTIIRPSGVYGPRNLDDVSYWFITSYGRSLATKFIVGSGKNTIQFVHAADVAQGFRLALQNDVARDHTYIISGERSHTYEEVYAILGEITGIPPPRRHVPSTLAKMMMAPVQGFNKIRGREDFLFRTSTVDSVTQDRSYCIERARTELQYQPRYDLRSGMQETVDWYRQNDLM